MKNSNFINYVLLLCIAWIWGSQFMFNEIALAHIGPTFVAACRGVIGMITLSIILIFLKEPSKVKTFSPRHYVYFFIIGFFEATLPFSLVTWGQQRIDSSIAAILMSTVPLFTILFVALFAKSEKLNRYKISSIALGFIGVMVLLGPQTLTHGTHLLNNLGGEIAILGGACSFAISLVMIRHIAHLSAIRCARNILFCASLQMLPLSFIIERPLHMHYTWSGIGSLLVLGILAAGIVYVLYVTLIKRAGAAFTSLNSYLLPVIGLALGVAILHEPFYWNSGVALFILLLAMGLSAIKPKSINTCKKS